jgi:hypothetical protein
MPDSATGGIAAPLAAEAGALLEEDGVETLGLEVTCGDDAAGTGSDDRD